LTPIYASKANPAALTGTRADVRTNASVVSTSITQAATAPAASARDGLPAGFPDDLPLMPGLSITAPVESTPARGTGRVTLSGSMPRDQVVAFFGKSMKGQEWSEDESRADGNNWLMSFTKGRLKVTVTLAASNGGTSVTILWETQQ
jgi:hypothetical protein